MNWLKPGGTLVYCTCSLEPSEGEAQIEAFLAEAPEIEIVPVTEDEIGGLGECVTAQGFLRTLPCHLSGLAGVRDGLDGFFAARLKRL